MKREVKMGMKYYNMDVAEYYDEIQLTVFTEPIPTDFTREGGNDENNMSVFQRIDKMREQASVDSEQSAEAADKLNTLRSIRRTVQTIYEYSRANKWDYFATFTIADKDVRYDYATAKNKLCKWFNNFKSRQCADLQYLCVPEQHKDGAWHFHALISGSLDDYIVPNHYGYLNLPAYKLGFTSIEPVRDNGRVANYITKYITKDLLSEVENAQRYFRQQGVTQSKAY
jgi:hypothetical protein